MWMLNAIVAHDSSNLLNAHLLSSVQVYYIAFYLLWQACAIYNNWWPMLSGKLWFFKLECPVYFFEIIMVRTLHLQL